MKNHESILQMSICRRGSLFRQKSSLFQTNSNLASCRAVGTERQEGRSFPPPPGPDFGRYVNHISIKGQIMPTTLVLVPNQIFRPTFGPDLTYCMSKNLWEKFKDEYSAYCPIIGKLSPKFNLKPIFFHRG